MSEAINVQRMVAEVRDYAQDQANQTWPSDTTIIRAIDKACQDIFCRLQQNKQKQELDFLDVAPSAGVALSTDNAEFKIPEAVYKIQLIEEVTSQGSREIPHQSLVERTAIGGRRVSDWDRCWYFSRRGDTRGKFAIAGTLNGVQTLRVWYIRSLAPLHYGVVSAAPGAQTLPFATTPTFGRLVRRPDLYVGSIVEITSDTPAGSIDQLRVIDSVSTTMIATVDEAWATTPAASSTYAMVPQIPSAWHELLAIESAIKLIVTTGAAKHMALLGSLRGEQREALATLTVDRQEQQPAYVQYTEPE